MVKYSLATNQSLWLLCYLRDCNYAILFKGIIILIASESKAFLGEPFPQRSIQMGRYSKNYLVLKSLILPIHFLLLSTFSPD